jgi:serine/threonine-protein kinase
MSSQSTDGMPDAAPPPGTVVGGKYQVERVLGRGGMGVVVSAVHLQLGERVALKFLLGAMAKQPEYVERFLREARAAVRIKSEHVARVLDVGTLPDGEPFMVMELLVGQDLHKVSHRRGPLPVNDAVEYVFQACSAIAEAHRLGIVHRDLKPGNLFLTSRSDGSELVKVLDFGIAKSTDSTDQALTATGDVLGSPLYMSPEHIRDARHVDGRSDIWALGNILYTLLAGRPAFVAPSSAGTLAKIIADPVPPLSSTRPDIAPELEAIVSTCLEKAPERRFQHVEDLTTALSNWRRAASQCPPGNGGAPSSSIAGDPRQEERPLAAAEVTATGAAVTGHWRPPSRTRLAFRIGALVALAAGAGVAALLVRAPRLAFEGEKPGGAVAASPVASDASRADRPAVDPPNGSAATATEPPPPSPAPVRTAPPVSASALPRGPRRGYAPARDGATSAPKAPAPTAAPQLQPVPKYGQD